MSEDTMRRALGAFEQALEAMAVAPSASTRRTFVRSVAGLVDAALDRVVLIVNQRADAGTLAHYEAIEEAEDDPTGTDAGAHPRG